MILGELCPLLVLTPSSVKWGGLGWEPGRWRCLPTWAGLFASLFPWEPLAPAGLSFSHSPELCCPFRSVGTFHPLSSLPALALRFLISYSRFAAPRVTCLFPVDRSCWDRLRTRAHRAVPGLGRTRPLQRAAVTCPSSVPLRLQNASYVYMPAVPNSS